MSNYSLNTLSFHSTYCVCWIWDKKIICFPVRISNYSTAVEFIWFIHIFKPKSWIQPGKKDRTHRDRKTPLKKQQQTKKKTDWILMRVLFYLLNYYATPLFGVRQWHFANAKMLCKGSECYRFKVSSRIMQIFCVFFFFFFSVNTIASFQSFGILQNERLREIRREREKKTKRKIGGNGVKEQVRDWNKMEKKNVVTSNLLELTLSLRAWMIRFSRSIMTYDCNRALHIYKKSTHISRWCKYIIQHLVKLKFSCDTSPERADEI